MEDTLIQLPKYLIQKEKMWCTTSRPQKNGRIKRLQLS
jgi:hypothetical protein